MQRTIAFWALIVVLLFISVHAEQVPVGPPEALSSKTEHQHFQRLLQSSWDEIDFTDIDSHKAARSGLDQLVKDGSHMELRWAKMFEKAKTPECRAKIATHFGYFYNAIASEQSMPFSTAKFENKCPEPFYDWENLPPDMHVGHVQNRTYQPPRENATYIDDPKDLRFLYAILTHGEWHSTIRLIETLYEDGHVFVVHVDGKENSDETYKALQKYAATRDHVHVLGSSFRVRVNWGGFSMVNATLQILQYSFNVNGHCSRQRDPLVFDKVIHLASSSYPLATRSEIRQRIASFPLDANFLHVIMKPTRPSPDVWHYFVECDDSLHRIYRLNPLNNHTNGMELFTSSQWFIISREFAEYLARAEAGTFVHQYLDYIEHVVVADETFFGTVLRHTPFCLKHHNRNFLHLQFDRWESELPSNDRDPRKCMMLDPNHCGRSPTTLTADYADILELSDDLFARKFVEHISDFEGKSEEEVPEHNVKDIVDDWRKRRGTSKQGRNSSTTLSGQPQMTFEGHGVLLVARETLGIDGGDRQPVPLCLGLGETGNNLHLVPCFHDWVIPTLAPNWEFGAVIEAETIPHNRWEMQPCTSDGHLERLDSGEIEVTPGNYSITGPRCMLKMMEGIRAGRCFDGDSGNSQPGGEVQVFPCVHRWVQFLSVGDGRLAPKGSLFFTIPLHIVRQIHRMGHEQSPHMCLGVWGRGNKDEVDWKDESQAFSQERKENPVDGWKPLSEWEGEELFSTQCSNVGAVVEWIFVPFIVEDNLSADDGTDIDATTDADEVMFGPATTTEDTMNTAHETVIDDNGAAPERIGDEL
jgi:hypothetical protein